MKSALTLSLLSLSTLGCTALSPTAVHTGPKVNTTGSIASDAHAAGGGGRPVELNYKDERERVALLGLNYGSGESGRVEIDPSQVAIVGVAVGQRPELAQAAFDEGIRHYASNARLEAIAAHTKAVLHQPTEARWYEGLGDALRAERLESRAEAAYRTGLDLEPSAELYIKLAELQWMRADRDGAVQTANEALSLDRQNGRAQANLARWSYFTGDYGAAWHFVHDCERLGVALPSQFRPLLSEQMAEPRRSTR